MRINFILPYEQKYKQLVLPLSRQRFFHLCRFYMVEANCYSIVQWQRLLICLIIKNNGREKTFISRR